MQEVIVKILTRTNLEDYIAGAAILGCGGGGNVDHAMEMLNDALGKGHAFKLADLSELPDDEVISILGWVGGGVPKDVMERVAPYYEKLPERKLQMISGLKKASAGLSEYLGKQLYSYLATETGPENGILPMYLAAIEGKVCVDADCCGRSKPELGLSLTNVAGIPIAPFCMVTPFDETLIVKNTVDDQRGEDISRYIAIASGGRVCVARCPATVAVYRKAAAPNQVTRCIRIGEAVRMALTQGKDPVVALVKQANAKKLFQGTVTSLEIEGRGGFNWGNWNIVGTGEFRGHTFKVWFKNENLLSWLDGEPSVVCPDLICIVDNKTGEGLSNFVPSGEHAGKEVAVLGVKAVPAWKTKRGLEIFNPRHFGYDIDYREW